MTLSMKSYAEPTIYEKEYIMPLAVPKDFKPVSAEGTYSIEEMQFSASKAYYNALESELASLGGESLA